MSYTPIKTITLTGTTLSENTNLTVPLSSFINTQSYLLVLSNMGLYYTLDLTNILNFVSPLDTTQPISTGLSNLFSDLFVQTYNNTTIPTTTSDGYYPNRIRVFNPISYKEYVVNFTSINTPTIINESIDRGILDDLVISSTDDLSNSLVAVNGVFHKTTMLNNDLYVLDGFRTMRISKHKDVTLVDTTKIGGHTVIPLTTSNVTHTTYDGLAMVTLSNPIVNQTICLVIDGYWYHLDSNIIQYIDSTHIGIKTNLLPLIDQFRHNPRTMYNPDRFGPNASQESYKYTDAYDTLFLNERSIPTTTLETVAFQLSRLTNFHSFLVVFNRSNIYTISRDLFSTDTLRFYYDYLNLPLSGMMSYGAGLSPSYLINVEAGFRKQIFISGQEDDFNLQNKIIDPLFIPSLIPDISNSSRNINARFVDYISM